MRYCGGEKFYEIYGYDQNLVRKFTSYDAYPKSETLKKLAHKVMYAADENAARVAFTELKLVMGRDAERAVHCLEKDLDSLLAHYRFDQSLWRGLKTTNPIERVNRELNRRTKPMDTLGERTLGVLVAFTAIRLEYGWQTTPLNSARLSELRWIKQNQIESAVGSLIH